MNNVCIARCLIEQWMPAAAGMTTLWREPFRL